MRYHAAGNRGELIDLGAVAGRQQRAEPVGQQPGHGPRRPAGPPDILTTEEQADTGAASRMPASSSGWADRTLTVRRADLPALTSTTAAAIRAVAATKMISQAHLPGQPRRGRQPRHTRLGSRSGPKLIVSTGYQCVPPDPGRPAGPATSGTDQGVGRVLV